jgi:Big-like domain-containing protein
MRSVRSFQTLALVTLLALAGATAGLVILGKPRPLGVVAANPRSGTTEVPLTTQLTITFSRPVDEASVRTALSVTPSTEGLVSAAGRRVAFTPTGGLRADTEYTLTVRATVADRTGHPLPASAEVRFRTRGQRIVVRTHDGRLVRASLTGATEPLAGHGVGEFAISAAGDLAYVLPAEGALIVRPAGPGPARRIGLPMKPAAFGTGGTAVEIRELKWAPDGRALGFLGATGDGTSLVYLTRLTEASPTPEALTQHPDVAPHSARPIPSALQTVLADIVYGRDTFAFTPDARGAIVRERNWEYVVQGFDGQQRGVFGPFLAVGNSSPRGRMVAFVDLDPADRRHRRVVAYEREGRLRAVSSPDRDSYAPRFAHARARVAFLVSLNDGALRPRYAVETADLDKGLQHQLTSPGPDQSDESPRWSPDDAWISFRRVPLGAPDRAEVWLVPSEAGPARRAPVAGVDARWSP